MHRNGGLLPVVVKLQVGGRENLGRGARLDALAACARREINKTQICQFSRFTTRQTRTHSSPDQNHIERAYRARPPVDRSADRTFVRSFNARRPRDRRDGGTRCFEIIRADPCAHRYRCIVARSRRRIASQGTDPRYARVGTVLERNRMDLTIRDSSNGTPQDPGVARVRNPFHPTPSTERCDATRRDCDASMKPRRNDETIFERRRTLNLARERGLARDGDGAEGDRNHSSSQTCAEL